MSLYLSVFLSTRLSLSSSPSPHVYLTTPLYGIYLLICLIFLSFSLSRSSSLDVSTLLLSRLPRAPAPPAAPTTALKPSAGLRCPDLPHPGAQSHRDSASSVLGPQHHRRGLVGVHQLVRPSGGGGVHPREEANGNASLLQLLPEDGAGFRPPLQLVREAGPRVRDPRVPRTCVCVYGVERVDSRPRS